MPNGSLSERAPFSRWRAFATLWASAATLTTLTECATTAPASMGSAPPPTTAAAGGPAASSTGQTPPRLLAEGMRRPREIETVRNAPDASPTPPAAPGVLASASSASPPFVHSGRAPPPSFVVSRASPSSSPPRPKPACSVARPTDCSHGQPNFAREVRPILENRCFGCHTGDGVAADEHDFSTPATLRAQAGDIAAVVATGSMPPRSTLREPLRDRETRALLAWASCGAATD